MKSSTITSRADLLQRYVDGPKHLRDALAKVPKEAIQWRPAPGKWSAHEVVAHCADSETMAAMRIRLVVAGDRPVIQGYDENEWARAFDYHKLPLDTALAQVVNVRAWTVDVIRGFSDAHWERSATHTESGHYTASQWLKNYAEHLEIHARQIDRNVAAWNQSRS